MLIVRNINSRRVNLTSIDGRQRETELLNARNEPTEPSTSVLEANAKQYARIVAERQDVWIELMMRSDLDVDNDELRSASEELWRSIVTKYWRRNDPASIDPRDEH